MKRDTKKIVAISVAIILILLILMYAFYRRSNENYYKIKEDKNNYLVYSIVEKNNKYVPYLNIKSEASAAVNDDIKEFTDKFIDNNKCSITYEYDISGEVLSLVLRVVDASNDYAPNIYFRSYNVSLKTLELIADESLLDFYDVSSSYVSSIIESKMEEYYTDILNEEYYDESECDYNCFLSYRGIDDYLDDVVYYVKNGKLMAYRPFIIHSIYGEEDYFNEDSFKFIIKES